MFETMLALFTGLNVAIAVTAIILAVSGILYMLDDDERRYMDQPPAFMRPVWPLIRVLAYFVMSNLPGSWLNKTERKLQKNGVSFMLTVEEYMAGCTVFTLLFPALGWFVMASSGDVEPLLLVFLGVLGGVLPSLWMRDARHKRDVALIRNLPVYLEYLSMCVDAGLNFSGALRQTVEKGPHGAMRNEFRIVLRDISSGQTRADALTRMAERVDLKDITIFVSAVIQAERMGSSMKDTLEIQAEQRLNERFQRAEKMAMEAPVKLVIPLVVFIFPLTFIILLFPIVIKFLQEGTL